MKTKKKTKPKKKPKGKKSKGVVYKRWLTIDHVKKLIKNPAKGKVIKNIDITKFEKGKVIGTMNCNCKLIKNYYGCWEVECVEVNNEKTRNKRK